MKFIALALIAIHVTAHAQTDLDEWVQQNRKETTHSFKVYHWASRGGKDLGLKPNYHEAISAKRLDEKGNKSEDTLLEVTPPEALAYFEKMTNSFYGKNELGWAIGQGLYAGIDPIQSIMYAGKRWILMEISVDSPVYYLDIQKKDYERFLKSEHKKFGQALKKNKIALLRYAWEKASFNFCGSRNDAYNFIRPELLNEGASLKVFVENLPADQEALKEYERLGEKFAYMFQALNKKPEYYLSKSSSVKKWLDQIMRSRNDNSYNLKDLQAETFECSDMDKLN